MLKTEKSTGESHLEEKMKRIPTDYAEITPILLKQLPKGVLLTTKYRDEVDTMTIGWGTIGIEWGLPVFVAYIRESRHTKKLLELNPEFTVNIPLEGSDVRRILGYCGTTSGRDQDKITEMDLHLVEGENVNVPAIAELPITLECKVIYSQPQNPKTIPSDILTRFYPTGDFHTCYYGQIADCYVLENDSE